MLIFTREVRNVKTDDIDTSPDKTDDYLGNRRRVIRRRGGCLPDGAIFAGMNSSRLGVTSLVTPFFFQKLVLNDFPRYYPAFIDLPQVSSEDSTVISQKFPSRLLSRRAVPTRHILLLFSNTTKVGGTPTLCRSGLARARLCMSPCSSDHIIISNPKVQRLWRVVVEELLHKHTSFSLSRLSEWILIKKHFAYIF